MSGVKITSEFFKINNQAPNNDIHFKVFYCNFSENYKKKVEKLKRNNLNIYIRLQ